MDFLC